MGTILDSYRAFKDRTRQETIDEEAQRRYNTKEAADAALVERINQEIAKIIPELSGENAVKAEAPDIKKASDEAAASKLNQQYESGETLQPEQETAIMKAAAAKYPSLGDLPARSAAHNLTLLGKPGGNLSKLSDIQKFGYGMPEKPTSTPEGDAAGAAAGKMFSSDVRKNAKPDYNKLLLRTSSELSPLMVKAGVGPGDVPVLGALERGAERQSNEDIAAKRGATAGGLNGWRQRSDDWDKISAIPAGPDKDQAIQDYLYKWAPSVGYGASPESINQAERKAVAVGNATLPVKAQTQYATTTAAERAQRDIQKENPMLTAEGSTKLSQSALAIKNLELLKGELERNNVGYFDIIKKTGQFANPKVNNAFQQVSEIVGRQQSGAAIANHEWDNFGKEILNKNFLLTPEGRQTALDNIDDYLDRFHSVGTLQTSDEEWYKKYNERARKSRASSGQGSKPTATPTQPQSGPAIGTVKGGYRFKGGNPADKNSWEPVK
jgi:hypothetical protein